MGAGPSRSDRPMRENHQGFPSYVRSARALDLEDPRLTGGHRDEPVEHLHRRRAVDRLREADVSGRAILEHEGWRAEYPELARGFAVVACQLLEDRRIGQVLAKPCHVEPRTLRDLLDDCPVIDVEPADMARIEERPVQCVESTLAPRGFGGLERKPAPDLLLSRRTPYGPAMIIGVHLGEREIPPANLEVPLT